MKFSPLLLGLALLVSASTASAQVVIGNGFSCEGTNIIKGTKTVTFKKAKSKLTTTIENLKNKLALAPKPKKQGIKDQITIAKASKTLLSACSKGQLAPNQVDPIFTQLASGSGLFKGTYNGNVTPIIGPISGDVEVYFTLNGTVFAGELRLGGNLGSALNAQPLAFQNDVGGIGFPAQFVIQNTFLGTVTITISQAGHIEITNDNASKQAHFQGDFGGNTITSTIDGKYSIFTYSGGATLTRQ